MRVTGWIWAAPAVFLVHDAEEVATMARWLATHAAELPAVARPLAGTTTGQFAVAIGVLFVAIFIAAAHGARRARRERLSLPFVLVAGALVANAITHLAQAVYFGGYTPGVVTAAVVVLPYGLALGRSLRANRLASPRLYAGAVAAGVVLQAPIALLALAAAGAL